MQVFCDVAVGAQHEMMRALKTDLRCLVSTHVQLRISNSSPVAVGFNWLFILALVAERWRGRRRRRRLLISDAWFSPPHPPMGPDCNIFAPWYSQHLHSASFQGWIRLLDWRMLLQSIWWFDYVLKFMRLGSEKWVVWDLNEIYVNERKFFCWWLGAHFRWADLSARRLCPRFHNIFTRHNQLNSDLELTIYLTFLFCCCWIFDRVYVVLAESLQKWRALHRQFKRRIFLQVSEFRQSD